MCGWRGAGERSLSVHSWLTERGGGVKLQCDDVTEATHTLQQAVVALQVSCADAHVGGVIVRLSCRAAKHGAA